MLVFAVEHAKSSRDFPFTRSRSSSYCCGLYCGLLLNLSDRSCTG